MRKRVIGLAFVLAVLTLSMSFVAVLPTTGQDTSAITIKLQELRSELQGHKSLQNKVEAVIQQIEAGSFNGALNKLQNDVKKSILSRISHPEKLIQLVNEIIDLIKGVTPPKPSIPDFELSAYPAKLEIMQGGSGTSNITVISIQSFKQEVTLTNKTSGSPLVTLSLNPSKVIPPSNGAVNSTLTVHVAGEVHPNTYEIIVTGTNGTVTHSVTVNLIVTAPPPIRDFSIVASPSTLFIQIGKSNTSVITVTSLNYFSQPIYLEATPSNQTIQTTIDPTRVSPRPNSYAIAVLTIHVAETAASSNYTLTVTATNGTLTRTTQISVKIIMETTPPQIVSVLRLTEKPSYNQTVEVLALIIDENSGIKNVILNYVTDAESKNVIMRVDSHEDFYRGIIPALSYDTKVTYRVYAFDKAGNWIVSADYSYVVADPYPPIMGVPTWSPLKPAANDKIIINVTAAKPAQASNIDEVDLFYKNKTMDDWKSIKMVSTGANYTAILANQSDTIVSFFVSALDKAGNVAETAEQELTVAAPISVPLAWILAVIVIIAAVIGGSAYYSMRLQRNRYSRTSTTTAKS